MLKKQIPFFAMICLLVCAAQSLAAQTKTITLGGKNGWSNLSVMDSVEFGTGRFGYESVLLSNDEHRVTSETDLLISFEDGTVKEFIPQMEDISDKSHASKQEEPKKEDYSDLLIEDDYDYFK